VCGAGRQAGSAGIIGPCCGNSSGKAGEGARRRRCLYRHHHPPHPLHSGPCGLAAARRPARALCGRARVGALRAAPAPSSGHRSRLLLHGRAAGGRGASAAACSASRASSGGNLLETAAALGGTPVRPQSPHLRLVRVLQVQGGLHRGCGKGQVQGWRRGRAYSPGAGVRHAPKPARACWSGSMAYRGAAAAPHAAFVRGDPKWPSSVCGAAGTCN
jgi:hypothetical protein